LVDGADDVIVHTDLFFVLRTFCTEILVRSDRVPWIAGELAEKKTTDTTADTTADTPCA
jgi:hypothetical protein